MLFFGIFLLILASYVAAHIAIFFSLATFFSITLLNHRIWLVWILFFLGSSFFLATFLSHWKFNFFTKWYYLLSGFWMGFLVNLLLFFALAWMVKMGQTLLNFPAHNFLLGCIALVGALVFSLYGVWNAFDPIVKSITLKVDHLPENWKGKKIVQISDVHLGHVYGAAYFSRVVGRINALKPDAVFITGDLFDGMDGSMDALVQPITAMQSTQGTYFITGNHETYLGVDKATQALSGTGVRVLNDELATVDGVQIIGISNPVQGEKKDIEKIVNGMPGFNRDASKILLIHEPVQIEAAKRLGVNLQLSGHTHKGQLFPFSFITKMIFGRYDFGLKTEGTFSIYTSSGLGGWGPPMRTQERSEIVEITLE